MTTPLKRKDREGEMGVEKAPCDDMAVKRESEADECGAKFSEDRRRRTPRGHPFTREEDRAILDCYIASSRQSDLRKALPHRASSSLQNRSSKLIKLWMEAVDSLSR